MAPSTFLTRIEAALQEGRVAVEVVRRFLDSGPRAVPAVLPTHSASPRPADVAGDSPLSPNEARARVEDLLPGLLDLASERRELSTGYRYLFENEPGLVSRIATVVEQERQCCRSLRFQITLQPNGGPIAVDVSGPEASRAFLAALGTPDRERARAFARKLADERRNAWIQRAG
jgi:hypothetical protein